MNEKDQERMNEIMETYEEYCKDQNYETYSTNVTYSALDDVSLHTIQDYICSPTPSITGWGWADTDATQAVTISVGDTWINLDHLQVSLEQEEISDEDRYFAAMKGYL